jgi:predicted permease
VTTANIRYAIRSLGKSPIFTVVAIVSLALALAVNTTMFALVDAVINPGVAYNDGGRAYSVAYLPSGKSSSTLEERFDAMRRGLRSVDAIVPYYLTSASVEHDNTIEDALVANSPPELFDILGVRAEVGRFFNEADTRPGALPVVLISHTAWVRLFHEQPLSKRLALRVGRGNYEVVGVMPRGMHFPASDVWLPPGKLVGDSLVKPWGPQALVRVRPGVTRDALQREMDVVFAGLNAAVAPRSPVAARLIAFSGGSGPSCGIMIIGSCSRFTSGGGPMFAVVVTVLLIACANLGTMLLARGMARRREIAIRMALGATKRAIAAQVLTECALIVGTGVALGVLLTSWAVYLLPHYATPFAPNIGDMDPTPSWRVFAFALAIAGLTLTLATALPAWRAAGVDPAEPIKEGAGSSGRIRDRYNPLIIVEVALSTALLMTAALFVITVIRLSGFDFSYAAKQLQVASVSIRPRDLPNDSTVERFFDDLPARMKTLPGVRDAATSRDERADGGIVYAEEDKSGDHWMNVNKYSAVSPSYLATLGLPVVDGRDFQPGDRGIATGVVIVDDSAARRLWPGLASPVGRMIKLGTLASKRPWLRVVGVVRSVELEPRSDVDLPPEPKLYVVYGHDRDRDRDLVVRGDGVGGAEGQARLGVAIRHELDGVAPWMRGPRVRRWLEGYDGHRQGSAFFAWMFGAFGGFGLVLCAVGLYGVVAYTVTRRLRELATRIALGAQPRDIARAVLHDCAVTVLAGIGVGAFLALAATRPLADSMSHVRYELAIALVAAEAVLLVAAVLACMGPIRQAVRANPVDVLRAC